MNPDNIVGINDEIDNEYGQTIEWLYDLHLFGMKFGLKKVKKLLEYFGNPQDQLQIIHIGGTNGKGSVAAMLSSILNIAGFKVGVNTSPHLSDFTERITINNRQISKPEVVEYARSLKEIRERVNNDTELGYATYFEVVTAMALKYFADHNVDLVVLEVGLGGTFDATNVVKPSVVVLTDISLDHTEHLGNTLTSVAQNKAGIIKPGCPVITANDNDEILSVIEKTCKVKKSPLYRVGVDIKLEVLDPSRDGSTINYQGVNANYHDLHVPLIGKYQGINAGLALGALELLSEEQRLRITEDAIRDGLKNTRWPGRLEVIQKSPWVILDGAHNPAGAQALHEAIQLFNYEKLILVFGCSEEKDIKNLTEKIFPMADKIILTKANIRRAAEPELILDNIKDTNIEIEVKTPVKRAVDTALGEASAHDLICICGSLFVVGEARVYLLGQDNGLVEKKEHRIHY